MVCRLPTCCGICFSSCVGSFIRAPYRILPSEFNAHLFPRGGYQPADCDQDCVARSKWLDICSFTIDCVLIPHFTPFYVAPRDHLTRKSSSHQPFMSPDPYLLS